MMPTPDYYADVTMGKPRPVAVGSGIKANMQGGSLAEFESALDTMVNRLGTISKEVDKLTRKKGELGEGGKWRQGIANQYGPGGTYATAAKKMADDMRKEWVGKNSEMSKMVDVIKQLKDTLVKAKGTGLEKMNISQFLRSSPIAQDLVHTLFGQTVGMSNNMVSLFNNLNKSRKGTGDTAFNDLIGDLYIELKKTMNTKGIFRDTSTSAVEKLYDKDKNEIHHVFPEHGSEESSDYFRQYMGDRKRASTTSLAKVAFSFPDLVRQRSMIPLLPAGNGWTPAGSVYKDPREDVIAEGLSHLPVLETLAETIPNTDLPIGDERTWFTEEADLRILEKTNEVLENADKTIEESTKKVVEVVDELCGKADISTKWVSILAKDLGPLGETLGLIGSVLDAHRDLKSVLPEGYSLLELLSPSTYGVGKSEWGKGFMKNLKDANLGKVPVSFTDPKTGATTKSDKFSIMKYLSGSDKGSVTETLGAIFKNPGKAMGKFGNLAKAGLSATAGLSASAAIPIIGAIAIGVNKIVKTLAKHSPVLKGVFDIFKTALDLFFMPIGNALGMILLPMAIKLIDWTLAWNDLWSNFTWGKFWQLALDTLKLFWHTAVEYMLTKFQIIIEFAQSIPEMLLSLPLTIAKEIFRWFGLDVGGFDDILKGLHDFTKGAHEFTRMIFDAIRSFFNDPVKYIVDALKIVFNGIGDMIGSFKHVLGFATGGIVTSATPAIIGEAGPEAVIPLDGLGGIGTTINISIGTVYGMNDFERKVEEIMNNQLNRARYR